jgi:hypothetical protein
VHRGWRSRWPKTASRKQAAAFLKKSGAKNFCNYKADAFASKAPAQSTCPAKSVGWVEQAQALTPPETPHHAKPTLQVSQDEIQINWKLMASKQHFFRLSKRQLYHRFK